MTLFEYLAIAFSLVLSMSAMRLLGGLPAALEPGRRYGVHLAMVVLGLFGVTLGFWALWSFREVTWTYPLFLVTLIPPAAIYFISATLVPENPADVNSWQEYYFSVRRRLFGAFIVWSIGAFTATTLALDLPLAHPARIGQAGVLIFGLVGFLSARPGVHRMLVGVCFVLIFGIGFLTGSQPGYIAR